MKIFFNFAMAITLITVAQTSSVFADEAGIEIKMVAEQEIETTTDDGKKIIKRIEPKLVIPGNDITYVTTYHNKGKDTAQEVAITNPVPEHMTYLDGTAEGTNTAITYSVDGGKQYATAEKLSVTSEDGKSRPATAKDYTHIRWLLDTLPPGANGKVSFKAKLN